MRAVCFFVLPFISYSIQVDQYELNIIHAEGSLNTYHNVYVSVSGLNEQNEIFKTSTIDCTNQPEWNEKFTFNNPLQLVLRLYNVNGYGSTQYLGQTHPFATSQVTDCNHIYSERMKLSQDGELILNDINLFVQVTKRNCDVNSGKTNKEENDDESDSDESESDDSNNTEGGIFGAYPLHGGNKEKQQIALDSQITAENVMDIQILCSYSEDDAFGYMGYPIVDDENNVYFADNSGFKSVNINDCSLNWKIDMEQLKEMVDECCPSPSQNTPALVQTKYNEEVVLFGYTAWEKEYLNISVLTKQNRGCYMVALRVTDGSLLWKTTIYDKNLRESAMCMIHGVQVDGHYAYGGVSNYAYGLPLDWLYLNDEPMVWRGKVYKIDINTGELVNEWYSLPPHNIDTVKTEGMYNGASIYPHMAIIDDYFVFGTSNLWNHPNKVENCLLGDTDSIPLESANTFDICGNNRSDLALWRCLEKDVYGSSIIILNKNTFELELSLPTQGISTWGNTCFQTSLIVVTQNMTQEEKDRVWYNNIFCSKYNIIPDYIQEIYQSIYNGTASTAGVNGDVNGVAGYYYEEKPYVAISSKNGFFWIIDLKSMDVKVSKEVAPWGNEGGASPFSLAVDEKNLIAIFTQRGSGLDFFPYRYNFSDGNTGCGAGAVFAIDLKTGYTIWEWVHPWMKMNEECFYDCFGTGIDCMDYTHFHFDWGQCERAFDGTEMLSASETSVNVVYPPKNEDGVIYEIRRGSMIGPATINNDMVFIPTMTGEIYVHSILDGSYIHTIYCPEYEFEYQIEEETLYAPNREGTRSGQTMFDDYLLFYCGATFVHPTDKDFGGNTLLQRGDLVVMKLKNSDSSESSENYK
eukprot:373589_1